MLSFANATGNLYNRLGALGKVVKAMNSYQSTQFVNLMNGSTGLVAQYNSELDIQAITSDAYLQQLSAPETVGQLMQRMAQATVNRMVYRDNALLNQNLTSQNVLGSIVEVVRQMKVMNATVLAQTVTATAGAFTGPGVGLVVLSVKRPSDGVVNENAYAETLTVACTSDSYSGGRTAGNESFRVTGQGSEPDIFAFDWPLGSNCTATLSGVNPGQSNAGGNLLTNSDFTTFTTPPTPDNWVVTTGSVLLGQENSITAGTGSALRLTGDGATNLSMSQQFNAAAGTRGKLSTQAQYGFGIFLRRGGSAVGAGTLVIDLVDGNGVVVNDAAGSPNTASIDLTALTTAYQGFGGSFRTPVVAPAAYYLRIRTTTPVSNGALVYLDKLGLGQMTSLYAGGPSASIHYGGTPFLTGTYGYGTVTNSRGAGGTLHTWQTAFARLLAPLTFANNILLPSSATPTVSDSLLG